MFKGLAHGRRRITAVAAAVALTLGAGTASADQVVLTDGDKLTGHIVTLDGGKLTINVPGIGDVKVDADKVATFSTDTPVTLKLADGTTEQRRVGALPEGGVRVDGGSVVDQHLRVADISAVNPPEPAWTGSILAGALLIRGNADTDTVTLGATVAHKTPQDDVSAAGSYLYGRTKDRTTGVVTTTAENWQVQARYDYNFTPKFYGFLDGLVRKDRIAFLDLRVVPSAGFGYKFVNDPALTFYTEAGVAWVYEKYTNNTPTRENVSLTLAYHLTHKFNDTVSVFNDVTYLPSLERSRNYIVTADLGLHAQMTKHFFGEAKVTLDYDSQPANRALKTDVFYAVNLGYNL